jgi:hypothetical protein
MFDELDRLRADESLRRLLEHYADRGAVDREAWQDRVMPSDGWSASDLVRLHGELLAQEWIEQNTGILPIVRPGALPQCYRVTAAGFRALKKSRQRDEEEAEPHSRAA